jgi:hypothetical protein
MKKRGKRRRVVSLRVWDNGREGIMMSVGGISPDPAAVF